MADRLRRSGVHFIVEPHLRFKGQPGEQYTMFFKVSFRSFAVSFCLSVDFPTPTSVHLFFLPPFIFPFYSPGPVR